MKKIKLHWQILIALILSILYGILFSTDYSIRERSNNTFIRNGTDTEVVDKLRSIDWHFYNTHDNFILACKDNLGVEAFKKNRPVFFKADYKNDAVIAV